MSKEQRNNNQVTALLGKAFVRLPRKILNMSMGSVRKDRDLAKLYIALVTKAFYISGSVSLGRYRHICRRGEFIGTYDELAILTRISRGSIGYYLRLLAEDRLIVINAVTGGTRIGICGYDYFSGYEMETDKQQQAARPAHVLADIEQAMGGRCMQDMDYLQERRDV